MCGEIFCYKSVKIFFIPFFAHVRKNFLVYVRKKKWQRGGILITKKKFIPLHDIGKNVLVYAIENAWLRYRLSKS
jgi:hypothetical protein